MTTYISNVRFSNNDTTIDVKFDIWTNSACTSHVVSVNVDSGNVEKKNMTDADLIALRVAQKNDFVRRTVAKRRKDIADRLARQQKQEDYA